MGRNSERAPAGALLRIGIITAAIVSAVLLFVVWAGWTVLRHPERFVTGPTVRWVLDEFVTGIEADWTGFESLIESESLLEKTFSFDLENLCVRSSDPQGQGAETAQWRTCFDQARVEGKVRLGFPMTVDALRIHSARIDGGKVAIELPPDPPETDPSESGLEPVVETVRTVLDQTFDWMTRLEVREAHAAIDDFSLTIPEAGTYESRVRLDASSSARQATDLKLFVSGVRGPELKGGRTQAELTLESSTNAALLPGALRLQGGVFMKEGTTVALDLRVPRLGAALFPMNAAIRARVTGPQWSARGSGKLKLGTENFRGRLEVSGDFPGAASEIARVNLKDCRVAGKWDEFPSGLDLSCQASYPLPKRLAKLVERGRLPDRVSGRVSAKIKEWEDRGETGPHVRAALSVALDPFDGQGTRLRGGANADFEGTLSELRTLRAHDGAWDIDLRLADFTVLESILADFGVVVPAPFNALKGPLQASSQGKLPADLELIRVPVTVSTDLRSANQRVDSVVSGQVLLRRTGEKYTPSIQMDAMAENVKLVLPTFSIRSRPPRLASDPRVISRAEKQGVPEMRDIETGEASLPAGPQVDYKVRVRTASPGSFKLVTEHAKNPVPVTLDLVLEDGVGPTGTVDVEPVGLKLFRREARLKNLVIQLRPEVSESPLRGELVVDYAEYVITVRLLGTVGDTTMELESDPPLEENDALAVLIFGQPINRLTSEQGSSVASLESALGGGLSLASLYALASTPVEQISYDPNTKIITARIRLDEKTSISVGMGGDGARTVGGRRRIGDRWVLGTDVIEDTQTGESRISTFLEWHYRY